MNNPQKPKNDTIRIDGQTIRFTEPANLDEGVYVAGKMTPEQIEESISKRWEGVSPGTIGAY